MARSPDSICFRCRARIPEAGSQRLCAECVAQLMAGDVVEMARFFLAGDRVQIIQGIFAGQAATVVDVLANGNVLAKSMIMNIPLEVEYLPWQIVKDGQRGFHA